MHFFAVLLIVLGSSWHDIRSIALALVCPFRCISWRILAFLVGMAFLGLPQLLLASSWQFWHPFHCFSLCMAVACHLHGFAVFCTACHLVHVWRSPFNLPVSPLLSHDVIRDTMTQVCQYVPIASIVFHCMHRFMRVNCPRIMCVCSAECAFMHITCHTCVPIAC